MVLTRLLRQSSENLKRVGRDVDGEGKYSVSNHTYLIHHPPKRKKSTTRSLLFCGTVGSSNLEVVASLGIAHMWPERLITCPWLPERVGSSSTARMVLVIGFQLSPPESGGRLEECNVISWDGLDVDWWFWNWYRQHLYFMNWSFCFEPKRDKLTLRCRTAWTDYLSRS